MRKEKYQGRRHSRSTYAITCGNGHKYVFIILPDTLLVEEENNNKPLSSLPYLDDMATARCRADIVTRAFSVVFAILWVFLLIAVGRLDEDTWYLFGVGLLGMVHNITISGGYRTPETHGIPIQGFEDPDYAFGRKTTHKRPKTHDVLLELERRFPGTGHALLPVFFPGGVRAEDDVNWNHSDTSKATIKSRKVARARQIYPDEGVPTVPPPDDDVRTGPRSADSEKL